MRKLMLDLHNPSPRARVFGFKEIYTPFVRDASATGEVISQGVGFLRRLFPRAKFVFHWRRNLSRAADSDFWQRQPQLTSRAARIDVMERAVRRYRDFVARHPQHAFATTLEGLTAGGNASELEGLFRFLGEPLTPRLRRTARSHPPLLDWRPDPHARRGTPYAGRL